MSINCAAEVGLLIGPSLNLVDWRNMRYILSGVGRRFPFQNSALLSASYDNT